MKFLVIGGIDLSQNKETEIQLQYIEKCKELLAKSSTKRPTFHIQNEGCQMNSIQTESIAAIMEKMGYEMVDTEDADAVVFNTCTVRENANQKIYGHLGHLKSIKRNHPDMKIVLFGCMMQEHHVVEKIRKDYKYVNLVFGTHNIHKFPELFYRALQTDDQIIDIWKESDEIVEGMPTSRKYSFKTGVSVMFGCNNFCSYCIVPYVRGRERSRYPEEIEKELRELVAAGYREITLLGQNVNSYGKDLGIDVDFSDLLRRLNAVPGDFWLRFMTSHPKDASPKLFSAMAECDKVAKQLHLPFQSGSDEILRRMNRRYTAEHYKSLIADAREKMPDITLSSDIIVGFPGETDEDFEQTLKLVQDTRFDLLFTFLYSPRTGTPAASYEDNATPQDKQRRFERLLKAQDEIVAEKQAAYQGRKLRLLVDGNAKGSEYPFTARTEGNLLVCVRGDDIKIGEFIEAEIEKTSLRCLFAHKL